MTEQAFCPKCGRPTDGNVGPFCTPATCETWVITHTYDHEAREWRPVVTGR